MPVAPGTGYQGRVVPVFGDLLVPPAVPTGQHVPGAGAAAEAGMLLAVIAGGVNRYMKTEKPRSFSTPYVASTGP